MPDERLHEQFLRQEQVKHALKTALACCLATTLAHFFHLQAGQLAVVFVYLLMTMGMPSPRLNGLLTQLAIAISASVSALLLLAFGAAPMLYLLATLLWIFTCVLFTNWFPLPATLGAMVSAIGIFVFFKGTAGATLTFYVHYGLNFFIAVLSVIVVHTLIWPSSAWRAFLQRSADVYARLEARCRQAANQIRSGEPPPMDASPEDWVPFRRFRQLMPAEVRRPLNASNPYVRLIRVCRSLHLRLWFFKRGMAPIVHTALPEEEREALASLLDRCAGRFHALYEGAMHRQQVAPVDPDSFAGAGAPRWEPGRTP